MKINLTSPEIHQSYKDAEFARILVERQQNEEYEEWRRIINKKPARIFVDLSEIETEEEYDTDYDRPY